MFFGPTSTTSDVLAGVDLTGRTAVVTGASGGIGFETTRALAAAGAHVVLADVNQDRATRSLTRLRDVLPDASAEQRPVDLADQASVRSFADAVRTGHVDLLVNNAAAVHGQLRHTGQGHEATLATNFFGHFLLTCLLMPALRAGTAARVVNVSSGAHRHAEIHWDDPHYTARPYDPREAYAQSKTAVAVFTLGLTRHTDVPAYTVRPAVAATGIYGDLTERQRAEFSSRVRTDSDGSPVEVAAATTVWACTEPTLAEHNGAYLAACAIAGTPESPSTTGGHAPWIFDPASADRLWAMAEQAVGQSFDWSSEGVSR